MQLFYREFIIYAMYFLECFAVTYLFFKRSEKRKKFKLFLSLTLSFGIVIQLPLAALIFVENPDYNYIFATFKFLMCVIPLFGLLGCFKIKLSQMLFVSLFAAAIQHWSSSIAGMIFAACNFTFDAFFIERLFVLLSFLIMLVPAYFLCMKRFFAVDETVMDGFTVFLLTFTYSVFSLAIVFMRRSIGESESTVAFSIAEVIFGFLIFIFYVIFAKKSREKSKEAVGAALIEKEKQQYEAFMRNADEMRSQLHDLKYLVKALSSQPNCVNDDKIKDIVEAFNSKFNTGNRMLDIILEDNEKMFRQKGIEFMCLTGDCKIDFIESYDLYSLLGNAFDNAAEYLSKITDTAKRWVSFMIKNINNFICIEISNYYEGDEDVYVGMLTTKTDGDLHGFGIKNMKKITEKYNGSFSVSASDGAFYINCTIPLR